MLKEKKLVFQKRALVEYLILLFMVFITNIALLTSDNPTVHVLFFWMTTIVAIFICRFDITHPYFWFTAAYTLYSTAYPLIFIMGYPLEVRYTEENLLYSFLGMAILLFILGINSTDQNYISLNKDNRYKINFHSKKIISLIIILLCLVLFASLIYVASSSYTHKNDMLGDRNIFFISGVYATRFLTVFVSLYVLLFIKSYKKNTAFLVLLTTVLIVSFSMFTGDRDAMYRFLIVLLLSLFIVGKINKKHIIILIPTGILFMVLSRYLKYFFVDGSINTNLTDQNLLYNFLTSDFHAAGQNLQVLINNPWTRGFHDLTLIVEDFLSAILPSSFFFNVGTWFNNIFYPNSYSRAFTLVGEGYVIAGGLGVIVVFSILGLTIKFLFNQAQNNVYWLVIYLYSIPTIISSFRSTLSIIYKDVARVAFLSMVIYQITKYILKKLNNN